MELRPAAESDRPALAKFAGPLQRRPERHICYLGLDAEAIAAEMVAEDEDWTAVAVVAERGDELLGWLMGSVDAEIGRVWWFGPVVDASDGEWPVIASALHDAAAVMLPDSVDQQEFGVDARFVTLERWAVARGFRAEERSSVLVLDPIGDLAPVDRSLRRTTAGDSDTVGRLHDEVFAGTHTTGARLVAGNDDTHVRLVLEDELGLVGYVAVERQPDGGGYIDYLGVSPDRRREGHGSRLIRAGLAALVELGCERAFLTVRESNVAARNLYRSLGFVEERMLLPLRLGFWLD